MNNLELILNMLAEATTTEISKEEEPQSFDQSKNIAKRWWNIAWEARKNIEKETGKAVIVWKNNLQISEH